MNPETSPIANTEAPSSLIAPVTPAPKPIATMTGFFDGISLDSDDGLSFEWFTKVVKVEPGDPLDIPQPVISGAVAISMHKPFISPVSQGFRTQTAQPTYQMDPEHRLSGIYAFNGEVISKFNPGENHNGYTAYFLQRHVYDPSQLSYSQKQRLDALQLKQAVLIPRLSQEQEEALAAKKKDRKAASFNPAMREIAGYESDKRQELADQVLDLKLKLSADLSDDSVANIRPLRRSADLITLLQDKIIEFDNRNEPIEGNDEDEPLTE
jgi:hypothetical protein